MRRQLQSDSPSTTRIAKNNANDRKNYFTRPRYFDNNRRIYGEFPILHTRKGGMSLFPWQPVSKIAVPFFAVKLTMNL